MLREWGGVLKASFTGHTRLEMGWKVGVLEGQGEDVSG